MNALTQPLGGNLVQGAGELSVRDLVDALASGRCDSAAFLAAVREQDRFDPFDNWEVLSLLDQYYRRGKISKEVFNATRMGLAEYALRSRVVDERPEATTDRTETIPAPPEATLVRDSVTTPAGRRSAPSSPVAAQTPEMAREPRVGDVLRGRYRIVGTLGRGGMGTVFAAEDDFRLDASPMGRGLAIKVLHTEVTKRAELLAELRREFQHLQSLSHPNIVRAYEFDRDGVLAFFSMELLNGLLLSRVLMARKRVPLPRAQALAIIRDVGAAIAHAHSRSVVHGDINPQNIFVTLNGELRVLDFGASHKLPGDLPALDSESRSSSFATPGYASCQVLEGARPDVRDDVFALACVSYLLLSGTHPFVNRTALEARAAGFKPKRPAQLGNRQWRALRAALHWDKSKRPGDVQTWLEDLDLQAAAKHLQPLAQLIETTPNLPKRFAFVALVTVAMLLLAAVVYWGAANFDWQSLRAAPASAAAGVNPPATTAAITAAPLATAPVSAAPVTAPLATAPVSAAPVTAPLAAAPVSAAPVTAPLAAAPTLPAPEYRAARTPTNERVAVSAPPAAAPARLVGAQRTPVSQLELAAATVDVEEGESLATVTVRRKGNLHGQVGFTWWTESGTAKPATDFAPAMPHAEYIEDGKASASLNIRLTDTRRAQARSFYVVIDKPEGDATLGARTLTMITLPANQPDKANQSGK